MASFRSLALGGGSVSGRSDPFCFISRELKSSTLKKTRNTQQGIFISSKDRFHQTLSLLNCKSREQFHFVLTRPSTAYKRIVAYRRSMQGWGHDDGRPVQGRT